jgi:hypothetical protein
MFILEQMTHKTSVTPSVAVTTETLLVNGVNHKVIVVQFKPTWVGTKHVLTIKLQDTVQLAAIHYRANRSLIFSFGSASPRKITVPSYGMPGSNDMSKLSLISGKDGGVVECQTVIASMFGHNGIGMEDRFLALAFED